MSPLENSVQVLNLDDVPSITSTSSLPKSSSETCEVCGDRVKSLRYGAAACLGCIVFFRRAILNKKQYMCYKKQNCFTAHASRCVCRSCRLQKCLRVGMRPDAVQIRDRIGPRKTSIEKSESPEIIIIDDSDAFLQDLANFQSLQCSRIQRFFAENQVVKGFENDTSSNGTFRRRAGENDINITFKLCLKQSFEWGNRLEPFRKLSVESKNSIISEYFIAFMLIDQGFKTSREADSRIWILQNGSFMHPDYSFGLREITISDDWDLKTQLHHNFVTELLHTVSNPFRTLEIDEIECAALKTIILLTPSCSKRAVYVGQEGIVAELFNKCMTELMEHVTSKWGDLGPQRFGEIILLISSIRCSVKTIYNQTKLSDLFNFKKLVSSVKDILVT